MPCQKRSDSRSKKRGYPLGRRGPKNINPQSLAWADRSARPKKSRNAASKIQAMRWVPTWSFARTRMRLRPNSSRGIRILRFFPGKPSRSCPFSRYRAPERLRPRIELSINYARARASEPGDVGKGLFHRFGRVQELAVAAKTAGDL